VFDVYPFETTLPRWIAILIKLSKEIKYVGVTLSVRVMDVMFRYDQGNL